MVRIWLIRVSLLLSILGLGVSSVQAQGKYRIVIQDLDSDLFPQVQAYFTVSDPQGLPVLGFDRNVFFPFEDGNSITDFELTPIQNINQPLFFVLLIDTSGSMVGAPLEDARKAGKNFLGQLSRRDQAAVIAFADEVRVVQPLTEDKAAAQASLDSLNAGGATALFAGLMEAAALLQDVQGRKAIILVTDGVDEGPKTYTQEQVVEKANSLGIPIYPLGFGGVDKTQLEYLSQGTGGHTQVRPDSSALGNMFASILQIMRQQYMLTFTSSLDADGAEHQFSISLQSPDIISEDPIEQEKSFIAQPVPQQPGLPDYKDGDTVGGTIPIEPVFDRPELIERMELFLDGGFLASITAAPFRYDWDTSTLAEGPHDLIISATDIAGNKGSLPIRFNVQRAIKIEFTSPTENSEIGEAAAIQVNVTSMKQLAQVSFLVDGQLLQTFTAPPYQHEWETNGIKFGEHTLTVQARDAAGNKVEENRQVTVRHPVTVTFLSPAPGEKLEGSAAIQVDAGSLDGIARAVLSLDGQILEEFEKPPPYRLDWPLYNIEEGSHTLKAEVWSASGHPGEAEVSVEVLRMVEPGPLNAPLIVPIVVLAFLAILIPFTLRKRSQRRVRLPGASTAQSSYPLRMPAAASAPADQAVLVELEGHHPDQEWPLVKTETALGRKQDENDIHLKGTGASRRHAVVRVVNGDYVLFTLNPENPVLVNDLPVDRQYTLRDGDCLELGETTLRFELRSQA